MGSEYSTIVYYNVTLGMPRTSLHEGNSIMLLTRFAQISFTDCE